MSSPIAIFKYLPRTLRVTREGRTFIALVLITGFAALNTGNNLLYLLAASLLSLIVVSGFLSELSLRKIALTAQCPTRFSAGAPGTIRLSLHNQKRRVPSFSLSVTGLLSPASPSPWPPGPTPPAWNLRAFLHVRPVKDRAFFKDAYFSQVPAQKKEGQPLEVTFPRRGYYRLEGFKISTLFPFGLFIKSSARNDPAAFWVYPKIHPVSEDLRSSAAMERAAVSDRTGQAAGFNHFREYHFGDDRRLIHWKLSARQGRWIVKEREREEGGAWTLYFNNAAPPVRTAAWELAFERAIEAVASYAAFLLKAGLKVSLQTAGERVAAGEGAGHLERLLQRLALLEPVNLKEMESMAAKAAWPDPAGEPAILIRMKEDSRWTGKESLFQAVVVVDAGVEADPADREEGRCR